MKTGNQYAAAFGRLYAKTPKAVFAALAFSFADRFKDDYANEEADQTTRAILNFLGEWRVLHQNGIIPQPPPKERYGS